MIAPRTERIDRGAKLRVHRRERVSHVWLVSPDVATAFSFVQIFIVRSTIVSAS